MNFTQLLYDGDSKVLSAQNQPFPIFKIRMNEAITKYYMQALKAVENNDQVNEVVQKVRDGVISLTQRCSNNNDQSKILIKLVEELTASYNKACATLPQETLKNSLAIVVFPLLEQWCTKIADLQFQREQSIGVLVDMERKIRQNSKNYTNKNIYLNFLVVIIKHILNNLQNFLADENYDKVLYCFGECQGLINIAKNYSYVSNEKMKIVEDLVQELVGLKRCATCLHNFDQCAAILSEENVDNKQSAYQALDLLQEANELCQEGDEEILAQIYSTIGHVWWERLKNVDHALSYLQRSRELCESFDTLNYLESNWYIQAQQDLKEVLAFKKEQQSRGQPEEDLDSLQQEIQEQADLGIQRFLVWIYAKFPQRKPLDETKSTFNQLKKARVDFHPDRVGQDRKQTYCEIAKVLNQQYQEMCN